MESRSYKINNPCQGLWLIHGALKERGHQSVQGDVQCQRKSSWNLSHKCTVIEEFSGKSYNQFHSIIWMASGQYFDINTTAFNKTFKGSITHVQNRAQITHGQPDELKNCPLFSLLVTNTPKQSLSWLRSWILCPWNHTVKCSFTQHSVSELHPY